MILAETIFLEGAPIGVIRQDSNSHEIAFSPIKGKSLLPQKRWRDMDELKAAVTAAYSEPEKDESPSD